MSNLPVVLTRQQQAQTISNHMPGGRVFVAKDLTGTVIRKFLLALADELMRVDSSIAEYRKDNVPDTTEFFIDEWEKALGIPDDCFDGTGTNEERRLAITTKLAGFGARTNQDYVDLAANFGITVTVESGAVHGTFPFVFPIKFYSSAIVARFTLVVRPSSVILPTFPYIFPIVFSDQDLEQIECLFNKVKPANVEVVFENPL